LPFVGAPFNGTGLGRSYTRGFFYLRGVNLFITSGIGTSILPVRFGVPPEIAVLDISAE
jgi:predicted MPP superfamily phosphohydrolase